MFNLQCVKILFWNRKKYFFGGFWNNVQDKATLETLPSYQTHMQNMFYDEGNFLN